jgi:enoyl-CoA hydratase/carnithine racemase
MPQRLAWADAMELLLVGEAVDAERAKEMGLVWKIVPHDDLLSEARQLADRLCKSAPLAVRATKEVAVRTRTLPWIESVRFGETMRMVASNSTDAAEGRTAFREKRSPNWQGK